MKHAGMILYHFKERGYPDTVLQDALNKVVKIDRKSLLAIKDTEQQTNEIIALTT